jgi:1,4-alpha-glucan branching enzyme
LVDGLTENGDCHATLSDAALHCAARWKGVPMKVYVPHTLRVQIPKASYVAVVGDFNNWHSNAHPLVQIGPESWGRIVDLPVGRHRYAYFVIEDAEDGSIRSRLLGEGSILCVPERPEKSVQVSAHPALALRRPERRDEALVA